MSRKGRMRLWPVLMIVLITAVFIVYGGKGNQDGQGEPPAEQHITDSEQLIEKSVHNGKGMQPSQVSPSGDQAVETQPTYGTSSQPRSDMEDNQSDEPKEKESEGDREIQDDDYYGDGETGDENPMEQCYEITGEDEAKEEKEVYAGQEEITLAKYDGGFFTIDIPEEWELVTAGEYSTFAFVVRDPGNPIRQVFYFGAVGPFYASKEQKDIDSRFVDSGGHVAWLDMPVVDPLTVKNMFHHFDEMAESALADEFMPEFPKLSELDIISSQDVQSLVEGSSFEIIRGLFQNEYGHGEGLFLAGVAPFMPFTGMPMGGNAFGVLITGVTASKDEFPYLGKELIHVLESFTVSGEYITEGIASQSIYCMMGILEEGITLGRSADIMNGYWDEYIGLSL